MIYEVDCVAGEREGFSCRLIIDDRVFYVKLFESPEGSARYFSADQKGRLEKEISKNEFVVWLNILAENEVDAILNKIFLGKKY